MVTHLKERIEYAREELAWLEAGAPEGEEPWRGWARAANTTLAPLQWEKCSCRPGWLPDLVYLKQPKMLHAIDARGVRHEWPKPMREAPEYGDKYYFIDALRWKIRMETWDDADFDNNALHSGRCQSTKEGAEQQLAAMRAILRGGE